MSLLTANPPATTRDSDHDLHDRQPAAVPPAKVGTVKWFNDQKGFGFVVDEEGRDVFVHYAVITGGGFKTLEEGESVGYDVQDGPKGRRATRVVRDEPQVATSRRGGR